MNSGISLVVIVGSITVVILLVVLGVWYYRKYYKKPVVIGENNTSNESSSTGAMNTSNDYPPPPPDGSSSLGEMNTSNFYPSSTGAMNTNVSTGGRIPSRVSSHLSNEDDNNTSHLSKEDDSNTSHLSNEDDNNTSHLSQEDDNNTSHLSKEDEERMNARKLELEEKKRRAQSTAQEEQEKQKRRAESMVKNKVEELERNIADRTRERDRLKVELETLNTDLLGKEVGVSEQPRELERIKKLIKDEEEQFKNQDQPLRKEEETLQQRLTEIQIQEQKEWDQLIKKAIAKINQKQPDTFKVSCRLMNVKKIDGSQYCPVIVNDRSVDHHVMTGRFVCHDIPNKVAPIADRSITVYEGFYFYSIYKDIYLIRGSGHSVGMYFYCVFQDNDTNKMLKVIETEVINIEQIPFLKFPIIPYFETKDKFKRTVPGYYSESGEVIIEIPDQLIYYIDDKKKECYLYYKDEMLYYYGMLDGKLTKYTYEHTVKPDRNVMVGGKPYRLQDQNVLVPR